MLNPSESFLSVGGNGDVRPPIVLSAPWYHCLRPLSAAALFLANVLNTMEVGTFGPNRHIPLPIGRSFPRAAKSQMQFVFDEAYFRRRRRAFGYVGEIQLAESGRGTTSSPYPYAALFPSMALSSVFRPLFLRVRSFSVTYASDDHRHVYMARWGFYS